MDAKKTYSLTTAGMAERFGDRHRGTVRYVPARRDWIAWEGGRWTLGGDAHVYSLVKETIRSIDREASEEQSDRARIELRQHAQRCENGRQIDSIISHASRLPGLRVDLDALDRGEWLLNVLNGTIDLRSGELRPHDPEDLITKVAPVEYVPDATWGAWERFLSETLPDPELRGFVQRAAGYSLTGSTREQVMFVAYGPTASGKSTFLGAVARAVGAYATAANFKTFLRPMRDGGGDKPRPDLVALQGARMVLTAEVSRGQAIAEDVLKQVTGQDQICVRPLHRAPVTFVPTWKIWLATNERPRVRADDAAALRRLVEIPFDQHVPEERRDRALPELLAGPEAQRAILAWAVEGCVAWHRDGLGPPEPVRDATQAFREDMDVERLFVREQLRASEHHQITAAQLFTEFKDFARDRGLPQPTSKKRLGEVLRAEGYRSYRSAGERGWLAELITREERADEEAQRSSVRKLRIRAVEEDQEGEEGVLELFDDA